MEFSENVDRKLLIFVDPRPRLMSKELNENFDSMEGQISR